MLKLRPLFMSRLFDIKRWTQYNKTNFDVIYVKVVSEPNKRLRGTPNFYVNYAKISLIVSAPGKNPIKRFSS